jgi:deazaflavin-dependent oxidoreductase (nitroreductase family)
MGIDLREPLFKVANKLHPAIIRLSGGRLGGRVVGMPVVVLTTTGRRTGQPRTTPLTAIEHEGRSYVIASKGGDEKHPAWYLNLVAHPEVTVQRGGRTATMTARVLPSDERTAIWPVVTRTYKGYASYQERTDREIPVVELVPTADPAA